MSIISIHAPARGATKTYENILSLEEFQSTLPRGERPLGRRLWRCLSQFQSTLPRGERRYFDYESFGRDLISIHAPARGATFGTAAVALFIAISIHAPARGATKSVSILKRRNKNFNPRSREGSDLSEFLECPICSDFNPRSREGSDVYRSHV